MGLLNIFKEISGDSWGTAFRWIGYSLVIGLAPIWSGIFIALICAPNTALMFVDRAQLAIYSTALLAAGFYIVGRDFKNVHLPGRAWFLLIMLATWLVAIAISSVATIEDLLIKISGTINYVTLRWLSIGGFSLSACIVFMLQALNQSQEILDVRSENAKQQEKLINDYEQLEEKKSKTIRLLEERIKKYEQPGEVDDEQK